jgi:ubiquitin fusion degradation protein 1
METLQCEEGDIIRVINATLPLGKFLKIQPQSVDFLDIHDPKAVLEQALRQYSTVTQGDIIPINYNNKIYRLLCAEVKPGNRGVSIVETDLEVDFAPPVGYVEPTKTSAAVIGRQQSMASSVLSVDEHTVHDDGEGGDDAARRWRAFEGTGKRLNERKHSSVLSRSAAAAAAVNSNVTESSNGGSGNEKENNAVDSSTPAALRIPPNKLWFGYKVEPATPGDKDAQNGKKLPPAFEGKGFSLRRA